MDHRISESANKVIPLFCPFSGDFLDDISDEQTDHAVVDLWQTDGDDTAAVNDENDDVFEEDDNCVKVKLCQDNEKIDLIDAAREACRSNSITPLLKQELKWLIQARRVEQGMDEMTVQFQTPAVAQVINQSVSQSSISHRQPHFLINHNQPLFLIGGRKQSLNMRSKT